MKIKNLHIEEYKVLKDFDIDFLDSDDNPAGVNGSRKTTLLEFVTKCKYQSDIFIFFKKFENLFKD